MFGMLHVRNTAGSRNAKKPARQPAKNVGWKSRRIATISAGLAMFCALNNGEKSIRATGARNLVNERLRYKIP